MTNEQIIEKIEELIAIYPNYCDFYIELKKFEKDYKRSDFYKQTHMDLLKLVKQQQLYKLCNLNELTKLLQEKINTLDLSNLTESLFEYVERAKEEIGAFSDATQNLSDIVR